MSHFSTLKTSKSDLETYLVNSGYWSTSERRERNACILSPSAFFLSEEDRRALDEMSIATCNALESVSESICEAAKSKTQSRDMQKLHSIAHRGARNLQTPCAAPDARIPDIIKVDLVRDVSGKFQIVEVDAYNPRGLGFNVLLDNIAKLDPSVKSGGTLGTVGFVHTVLSGALKSNVPIMGFIQSEHERYYNPSFEILYEALKEHHMYIHVIKESDYNVIGYHMNMELCHGNLFMIPESLENVLMRQDLLEYDHYVIPPKAYLGSKLLLPYLRECEGMGQHIPETHLVSRYDQLPGSFSGSEWVLKRGQSSGMKGVYFSDEEDFDRVLSAEKKVKRPNYILQEAVEQKMDVIDVFDKNGNVEKSGNYFRYIAQFSKGGLLGLDITGRPDRAVHGAKDCIMIPTVLS